MDTAVKKGHECESTGRFTRKRPISYEQLYPSLFSRRRKSNTARTPTVTHSNVFDSVESDGVVKLKSGVDGDATVSGCLPSKQKRKRGQNSIIDSQFLYYIAHFHLFPDCGSAVSFEKIKKYIYIYFFFKSVF